MSGRSLAVKRRRRPELPLVPLIDVLVMLVLFAFVTMRFSVNQIRNLTLPKMATAGKNQLLRSVTITIDKDGKITIDGRPSTEDQMPTVIAQLARTSKDTPVLLKADQDSHLKELAYVVDILRKAGMTDFHLQTQ